MATSKRKGSTRIGSKSGSRVQPKTGKRHPTRMTLETAAASLIHDDDESPAAAIEAIRNAPEDSPGHLLGRAYDLILQAFGKMGYDIHDDNFRDTGPRAAKGLLEMVHSMSEINVGVDELVGKSFSARYDEMVISKQNVCFGLCPHHLLPVIYRISIAYLPSKKVLGISKLSRLAKLLSRRPVLQEELTQDLAEVLHTRLQSRGSAAYVEGLHLCMAARGSESHEARVVTSAVRGVFREQPATREEFLKLVTSAQTPLI